MARLSGVQRDVLALFRSCIRAIRDKPPDTQRNWRAFVRKEFRQHLVVSKKDFATIEHLLRTGQKRLDTYSQKGIKNIKL